MPWFYCDSCGDSIKKPKVAAHCNQCRTRSFTCIDCSRVFDLQSVHGHTTCVTEHEKYAQGATKPGGFAAKGFYGDGAGATGGGEDSSGAEGLEFLSLRPPWNCTICNVNCTSKETLMGHAAGAKHKRRAKAAIAARKGTAKNETASANVAQVEQKQSSREDASEKESDKKKESSSSAAVVTSSNGIKWKKLAKAELKRSGGTLKAKKLLKAIIAAAGVVEEEEEISENVLKKLEKSKKFKFEGKMVSLEA